MFSVPIDVLMPDVYLRIAVEPLMTRPSGEQPRMYLEFGWYSLPEDVVAARDLGSEHVDRESGLARPESRAPIPFPDGPRSMIERL
jgi:hypothetical protein